MTSARSSPNTPPPPGASNGTPSVWGHQFYHFDLRGNTTAQTDSNGWVNNIIDMEAFGTILEGGQAGFRLTTKEYDPEAGAYYFNERWYDKWRGVFIQRAIIPVLIERVYDFTGANPIKYSDPNGLFFGVYGSEDCDGNRHWRADWYFPFFYPANRPVRQPSVRPPPAPSNIPGQHGLPTGSTGNIVETVVDGFLPPNPKCVLDAGIILGNLGEIIPHKQEQDRNLEEILDSLENQ